MDEIKQDIWGWCLGRWKDVTKIFFSLESKYLSVTVKSRFHSCRVCLYLFIVCCEGDFYMEYFWRISKDFSGRFFLVWDCLSYVFRVLKAFLFLLCFWCCCWLMWLMPWLTVWIQPKHVFICIPAADEVKNSKHELILLCFDVVRWTSRKLSMYLSIYLSIYLNT